jgi:hypothetical protein
MALIADEVTLAELRAMWRGVQLLRDRIQMSGMGAFAMGSVFHQPMQDVANNLPFIHGCSVLGDSLRQLANEGHFECRSIFLGKLFAASEGAIPWTDRDLIRQAIESRNGIAHRGEVIPRAECWRFLDAIRTELQGWGVVVNT